MPSSVIFFLGTALLVIVVLMWWDKDFFKPMGCPFCGAPEEDGYGWVKCRECGKAYWSDT